MAFDVRTALITGVDIPIAKCQLTFHQPTITDISRLGDTTFFTGVQTLGLNKSMFNIEGANLDEVNNFQIFIMLMKEKESKDKKDAVMATLPLFFPDYKVMMTPQSLLFTKGENTSIVDVENFETLQKVIRLVCCTNTGPMDQSAFNPADEKAKEIADKLMAGRAKIAAEKKSTNSNVFVQYASILSIALGVPIKDIVDKYTMFQLYDAIERYHLWLNWDLDIKTRLAGGKPENNPDNWMKSLH